MLNDVLNEIASLLSDYEAIVNRSPSQDEVTPHDYNSLLQLIVHSELTEEITWLRNVFNCVTELNYEDVKEQFKARCASRANRNANTVLSFTAMPKAACNELYWKVACLLFSPKSLAELLGIITPDIGRQLSLSWDATLPDDFSQIPLHARKVAMNTPELALAISSIQDADTEKMPANLAGFIFAEGLIFNLAEIAPLSLAMHQKVCRALHRKYPIFANALYQHNDALKTLYGHIQLLDNNGQCPRDALELLIREFKQGGSAVTGQEMAAMGASLAFNRFMTFLEHFSAEDRDKLLEMKDGNTKLGDIINFIKAGNCVETAARLLKAVIDNRQNSDLLNTRPNVSDDEVRRIRALYSMKNLLDTAGTERTGNMPSVWLKKMLARVTVRSGEDFLSLFLAFAPEQYNDLLRYATFNHSFLDAYFTFIQLGVLNAEQIAYFDKALLENVEKFVSRDVVSFFIQRKCKNQVIHLLENHTSLIKEHNSRGELLLQEVINEPELFLEILKWYPEEERLSVLKEKNGRGYSILFYAADKPELLFEILKFFPVEERLSFLKEKDNGGNYLLFSVAFKPDLFRELWALLPPQDRLAALKEKSSDGKSLLTFALKAPEIFWEILNTFSAEEQLVIIEQENLNSKDYFFYSAAIESIFYKILELYSPDDRLTVLKKKYKCSPIIHFVVSSLDMFIKIFELLPEKDRLAAVNIVDNGGFYTVNRAISNPKLVAFLLNALPDEKTRVKAVMHRPAVSKNETAIVMVRAISNTELLSEIWNLFSPEARIELLQKKIGQRVPLLHYVASHNYMDSLYFMLGSVSEESRLALVKLKGFKGRTFLDCLAERKDWESLFNVVNFLPQNVRYAALNVTNDDGQTIIDYAVKESEFRDKLKDIIPEIDEIITARINASNQQVDQPDFSDYAAKESALGEQLNNIISESIALQIEIPTQQPLQFAQPVELEQTEISSDPMESSAVTVKARVLAPEIRALLDNLTRYKEEREQRGPDSEYLHWSFFSRLFGGYSKTEKFRAVGTLEKILNGDSVSLTRMNIEKLLGVVREGELGKIVREWEESSKQTIEALLEPSLEQDPMQKMK
jgi:hypothetical protein